MGLFEKYNGGSRQWASGHAEQKKEEFEHVGDFDYFEEQEEEFDPHIDEPLIRELRQNKPDPYVISFANTTSSSIHSTIFGDDLIERAKRQSIRDGRKAARDAAREHRKKSKEERILERTRNRLIREGEEELKMHMLFFISLS